MGNDVDVEKVLDQLGVKYHRSGKRFMASCPFHNDETPSCGLWADTGYFKCFGCHTEGSFAMFISEVEDIPLTQATRMLRGQDRMSDLEDSINRFLDREEKVFKYFKWESFCATYPAVIPTGSDAWNYLTREGGDPAGRKLTAETIERFHVRWGGDTGKFRYRVILPIQTIEGKLLSYVGRAIRKGMVPKTRKARSPHRTLFGLKEIIGKTGGKVHNLIITEGEFDAVYLQQYGIPAVANMGTSPVSSEKIRLLRRYADRLVLSYDGDETGQTAMYGDDEDVDKKKRRVGELDLLAKHMPTVSVHLPDGFDPNKLSEKQVDEIYGEWRLSCLKQK